MLFVLAALIVVGAGSPALAWGGKPDKGTGKHGGPPGTIINDGCKLDSSYSFTSAYDAVYYNNTSNNVNVRNAPNGSCIIATLAPGADVVGVPCLVQGCTDVYVFDPGSNRYWRKVAYYEGNCQTCTNYDWQHTGWVAASLIPQATQGFTCEAGSGCPEYSVSPCGGCSGKWTDYCPPPIAGQTQGSTCPAVPPDTHGIPESNAGQCLALNGDANINGHGQNSCSVVSYHTFQSVTSSEEYASDENPNWFLNGVYIESPYFFVWNYDWYAH